VARLDVLAFEANTAAHYGQVRAELQRVGAPCGPHDLRRSRPQRGADRRDQQYAQVQPHAGNQSRELGLTEAKVYSRRAQFQKQWTEFNLAAMS
jgi:hypothetical protein